MRLYLHPDLVKALTPTEKLPEGRARGLKDQDMRLRQTRTGSPDRKTGRLSRDYAGTAENKPSYRCKNCGAHVTPPRKQVVNRELSKEEREGHEDAGVDIHWGPVGGPHTLIHPPKVRTAEGTKVLEHGAVTENMVPNKDPRTGKKFPGSCPTCHAEGEKGGKEVARASATTPEVATAAAKKQAATEKSLDMLYSMFKAASNVSEEVKHLMEDKDYPQKRAVAAALSMQREGKIKKSIPLLLTV